MKDKLYYLIRGSFYQENSIIIVMEEDDRYYKIVKVVNGDTRYLTIDTFIMRSDRGIKILATSDSLEEITEMAMMEIL